MHARCRRTASAASAATVQALLHVVDDVLQQDGAQAQAQEAQAQTQQAQPGAAAEEEVLWDERNLLALQRSVHAALERHRQAAAAAPAPVRAQASPRAAAGTPARVPAPPSTPPPRALLQPRPPLRPLSPGAPPPPSIAPPPATLAAALVPTPPQPVLPTPRQPVLPADVAARHSRRGGVYQARYRAFLEMLRQGMDKGTAKGKAWSDWSPSEYRPQPMGKGRK